VALTQIPADHAPLSTTCHVGLHVNFSFVDFSLDLWPSPSSVKWTWMVSSFSTNESSYIAMVMGIPPCVWSGPKMLHGPSYFSCAAIIVQLCLCYRLEFPISTLISLIHDSILLLAIWDQNYVLLWSAVCWMKLHIRNFIFLVEFLSFFLGLMKQDFIPLSKTLQGYRYLIKRAW
jgi:hypothetical protein